MIERSSFPSPWSLKGFMDEIYNPVSRLWALMTDDTLIGYICFWMFADEIHLLNIAVEPEKRHSGFGKLLLNKMIETGSAQGIGMVWLEVRPSNLAAINFYQAAGFRQAYRRIRYYRDTNEDAIIMSLDLATKKTYTYSTDEIPATCPVGSDSR